MGTVTNTYKPSEWMLHLLNTVHYFVTASLPCSWELESQSFSSGCITMNAKCWEVPLEEFFSSLSSHYISKIFISFQVDFKTVLVRQMIKTLHIIHLHIQFFVSSFTSYSPGFTIKVMYLQKQQFPTSVGNMLPHGGCH